MRVRSILTIHIVVALLFKDTLYRNPIWIAYFWSYEKIRKAMQHYQFFQILPSLFKSDGNLLSVMFNFSLQKREPLIWWFCCVLLIITLTSPTLKQCSYSKNWEWNQLWLIAQYQMVYINIFITISITYRAATLTTTIFFVIRCKL